ncbi:unnamed protein product, partial [Mesorhabditis spiculigera]
MRLTIGTIVLRLLLVLLGVNSIAMAASIKRTQDLRYGPIILELQEAHPTFKFPTFSKTRTRSTYATAFLS